MDVGVPLIAVARLVQGPFDRDTMHAAQVRAVRLRDGNVFCQAEPVRHSSDNLSRQHGILANLGLIHRRPVAEVRADVPPSQHVIGARGIRPAPVDVGGLVRRASAAPSSAHDTPAHAAPADEGKAVVGRRHSCGILSQQDACPPEGQMVLRGTHLWASNT